MKLFELNDLQPFKTDDTDMPLFNDMLKHPDYFREKKGATWEIVWMSPHDYIDACRRGFHVSQGTPLSYDLRADRDRTRAQKYAEMMKQGTKFPMVTLDYRHGFSQEGLHRAIAAELLGVKRIPVMMIHKVKDPEEEKRRSADLEALLQKHRDLMDKSR